MEYFILFIALLLLIFGTIFIYLALSKNKEKKERILDSDTGTNFDLIFILLDLLRWFDKKLHTKYIANTVSLLLGLFLIVIGLFIFVLTTNSLLNLQNK